MAKKKGNKFQNKRPGGIQAQANVQKNVGQAGGGGTKKKKRGKKNASQQKKTQILPTGGGVLDPQKPVIGQSGNTQGGAPPTKQSMPQQHHQVGAASHGQVAAGGGSSIGHVGGDFRPLQPQNIFPPQMVQQSRSAGGQQFAVPQQQQRFLPPQGPAGGQQPPPHGQPQQMGAVQQQVRSQQPRGQAAPQQQQPLRPASGNPGTQNQPLQGQAPQQYGQRMPQQQGQRIPQQQGQRMPQQQGRRMPQQQGQYMPQQQSQRIPQQQGQRIPQQQGQHVPQQPIQQFPGGQQPQQYAAPQQNIRGGQQFPPLQQGQQQPAPAQAQHGQRQQAAPQQYGAPQRAGQGPPQQQQHAAPPPGLVGQAPPQQQQQTQRAVVDKMATLSIGDSEAKGDELAAHTRATYAPNKRTGTIGKIEEVISNMYRTHITVQKMLTYDVQCFDSDGAEIDAQAGPYRKSLYFALKPKLKALLGMTFWDNTMLRAFHDSGGATLTVSNAEDVNPRLPIGRMVLTCVRADDLSDPNIEYEVRHQYIHIMLKQLAVDAGLLRYGRSWLQHEMFGASRPAITSVRYKSVELEVHQGFQLSIENVVRSLFMLKADIIHNLVSSQTCAHIFDNAYARAATDAAYRKTVREELVNSIVLTRYNPRLRYRVHEIAWDMNPESKFRNDKDELISYRAYLETKWNFTSQFPYNGLLVSKQKFRNAQGIKEERNIYLVPDACHRTGLTGKMKNNISLKTKVAKETKVSPANRVDIADAVVKKLRAAGGESKNNDDAVPLTFEIKAERVTAKILLPPKIIVNYRKFHDRRGTARIEIIERQIPASRKGFSGDVKASCIDSKFAVHLKNWAIVYVDNPVTNHAVKNTLVPRLKQSWDCLGTAMTTPRFVPVDTSIAQRALPNWRAELDKVMKKVPDDKDTMDLVMCVLPQDSDAFYHLTSERGSFHGVVTQCMKDKHLFGAGRDRLDQVAVGLTRQMKAKNCSNPWIVDLPKRLGKARTMLVGMDVNHDRKNDTSTVGFSSTYGDTSNYFNQHRFQEFQKESITDASGLMREALLFFEKKAGRFPVNIVIFRDGVSDSQFDMVMKSELRAYRAAAADAAQMKKQVKWTPKFTMIITQKRVSVRFTTKAKKSVSAGTVVDTGVIADGVWNFYIHPCDPGPTGHAVPTRFVILLDEVKFTQNDMQTMCHDLCYAYPNWAGPIRVPCPAMMAHGVAFKFGSGRAAFCDERLHGGVLQEIQSDNVKLAAKNHCL